MTPLPLEQIGLHWRDHRSALWWLGLLYRKPALVEQALKESTRFRALFAGLTLYLHTLPYILILSTVGRGLLYGVLDLELAKQPPVEWMQLIFIHMERIAFGITGGIVLGITLGIAGGIVRGIAGGIVRGIAGGIAFGIAAGIILGIVSEITLGSIPGITLGITFGIPLGIALGITLGIALGIIDGIAVGIIDGIAVGTAAGIILGIVSGIIDGITLGITVGTFEAITLGIPIGFTIEIAVWIAVLRAYYHPFHLLFIWPTPKARWYPWHPVAWDDLCSLPFPRMDHLLAAYAEFSPDAGQREIERLIDHYPSQRMAALRARAILIAREAGRENNLARLDMLVAKLPEGDKGFLAWTPKLRGLVYEICQLQQRLDTLDRPFLREPTVSLLCEKLKNFQSQVSGYPEPLGSEFRQAANNWLAIAEEQHHKVRKVLDRQPAPQVFRAGDPVNRSQEAFIPRDGVLGDLDRQLTLSTGCPGLILYGRRRMGKSTLLQNMDGFLPTSMRVIVVSMQNPDAFTSLAGLLNAIAKPLLTNWPELEPATDASNLQGFFRLLSACNERLEAAEQRLLLALDEYENLDRKLGKGVFNEDLLNTLRESIQYHRHITWIFAGSHAITELTHASWPSYLISARTVEVPFFSEAETRQLLTEPMRHSRLWEQNDPKRPRFDPLFWGDNGIERIHHEAGGWPHLVQLLAETTVDLINDSNRSQANGNLLEQAAAKAIVAGDTVLRQLLQPEDGTSAEWDYLRGFRRRDSQPPPEDEAVFQALRRRWLVTTENGDWRLRVPLMQRWLRERG